MCRNRCDVEKLYAITEVKNAGNDLRRKIFIDSLQKKLKRAIRRKERKMARKLESSINSPKASIDTEDSLNKDTCNVENLYAITKVKNAGDDLRRKVLLDHSQNKLECKIPEKQREMGRNFELMIKVPEAKIDTEDILGLDDFYAKLKKV